MKVKFTTRDITDDELELMRKERDVLEALMHDKAAEYAAKVRIFEEAKRQQDERRR